MFSTRTFGIREWIRESYRESVSGFEQLFCRAGGTSTGTWGVVEGGWGVPFLIPGWGVVVCTDAFQLRSKMWKSILGDRSIYHLISEMGKSLFWDCLTYQFCSKIWYSMDRIILVREVRETDLKHLFYLLPPSYAAHPFPFNKIQTFESEEESFSWNHQIDLWADLTKCGFYKTAAFVILQIVANSSIYIYLHFDVSDKSSTLVFRKIQTFESKEEPFSINLKIDPWGIWRREVFTKLQFLSFLRSLQIPLFL